MDSVRPFAPPVGDQEGYRYGELAPSSSNRPASASHVNPLTSQHRRKSSAQLAAMADRLEAFNKALHEDVRHRRQHEAEKQQHLQEMVLKLEAEILSESKRRENEDQKLRALVEKRTGQVAERLEARLMDLQANVKEALDSLHRELATVSASVKREGETRRAEGQVLARAVLERVEALGRRVEEERVQRLESENRVAEKVSGDMRRVFDAWEADKSARDGAVRRVEQELKDAIAARAQDAEAFEQAVMDELRAIRVELEAERAARVMEDEAIVQAMEVNAEQVQDTLKLMQL